MNIRLIFGILIFMLTACNGNRQSNETRTNNTIKTSTSLNIGSKVITNEIAGSAYRKKAISYFVVNNKDTSDFNCIFIESKDNGGVGIDLNIPYMKASMTYDQRMKELITILPKAAIDFNFDSLTSISFGRLILSGDLAIEVTKQYKQKFGDGNKVPDNKIVEQFIKDSKLGTDLDEILKPYSISIDSISLEKLFFTTKEDLLWASKTMTDSTNVPDKILDCILVAKLKRNENKP